MTVHVFGGDGEKDEIIFIFLSNALGNIARQLGLGPTLPDYTVELSKLKSIIIKCSIYSQLSSEHFD